jgi:uncharacterized protein YqjF (DUF2071 family)
MVAGLSVIAPPLPWPVLVGQFWGDVTFLHWPVRPDAVAHLFPDGTRPDVFDDGFSYVGLVPFVMRRTALGDRVPLPYLGAFAETNVRLYSVDDAGRHGVLFRSLETQRLAVVPVTRIGLGVPYTWAKMRVTHTGDRISYGSVRRWPRRGLRSALDLTIGAPLQPTPLQVWLTARWGAHTRKAGRTWWVPNDHPEWPLCAAEIDHLRDDLITAGGVAVAGARLPAMFSSGVSARFGLPVPVR